MILLCTPCTVGICKNHGAHCRNTKVPVQFELVNSKHAPICNDRSCDIVIVLPDFVVVLLDFVVVLLDFVVKRNKNYVNVSVHRQLLFAHTCSLHNNLSTVWVQQNFGLSAHKRQSPSTKHPSHPLPCSQAPPFCYKK